MILCSERYQAKISKRRRPRLTYIQQRTLVFSVTRCCNKKYPKCFFSQRGRLKKQLKTLSKIWATFKKIVAENFHKSPIQSHCGYLLFAIVACMLGHSMSQTQKIFLLLASDNARFSVRNLISFLCQLNFKYIYIIGSVVDTRSIRLCIKCTIKIV